MFLSVINTYVCAPSCDGKCMSYLGSTRKLKKKCWLLECNLNSLAYKSLLIYALVFLSCFLHWAQHKQMLPKSHYLWANLGLCLFYAFGYVALCAVLLFCCKLLLVFHVSALIDTFPGQNSSSSSSGRQPPNFQWGIDLFGRWFTCWYVLGPL